MSLIKMLSFAKSLRGEDDVKASYQLTQDNLMPNFSRSSLRPVQDREEPIGSGAGCGREGVNGVEAEVVREVRTTREGRFSLEKGKSMKEQQDEILVNSSSRSGVVRQAPTGSGASGQRSRWLIGRSGSRATLRADAKGQLSLEFVKVVRNDLSESDLELVPAKPLVGVGLKREAAESASSLEKVEPEPSRWSRFTARLFGSGNPT